MLNCRIASGYSAADIHSLGFKKPESHAAMLKGTRAIKVIDPAVCDAIFIADGQSRMVTMVGDTALHAFVARSHEAGNVVAIVRHGTCFLLKTRLANGELLVKGKTWTGFANSEAAFADSSVGKRIQPFWIGEEARKIEGTNFMVIGVFKPFAVRDGNPITSQQQNSGAAAAAWVIETLGRRAVKTRGGARPRRCANHEKVRPCCNPLHPVLRSTVVAMRPQR